jgi:hypothetical protein
MSAKILVSDTNIWIDLHRSGLLETVFALPHQFVTTDFVWRELKKPPGQELTELGLVVKAFNGEEVTTLFMLRQTLGNSSLADVSCYFLAKERGWTLLTNDGALRKSGQQSKLEVRGVLSPSQLADSLESMLKAGARLPKNECHQRLDRWR